MKEGYKKTEIGWIPKEWEVIPSSKIAEITSSKRIHQSEYVTDGIPFFRSKEIILKSKGVPLQDIVYISSERFNQLSRKFGSPQEGDILITAVGTIGITYFVQAGEKFYFKDGNLMWLRNFKKKVDTKYLKFFFSSFLFKNLIDKTTSGSSQKALTIEKFGKLEAILPPLPEQQKIAKILSTVDEKIEVIGEEINQTQELKRGLMQRLLTKGIAHTRFKDSPLGKIPEGWQCGTLDSIARIVMGQSPPGDTYNSLGNGMPMLNGPTEFTERHPIPVQYTNHITKVSEAGDILFCVRGSSTGRMNIADREYCIGRGLAAIRAKKGGSTGFIHYILQSLADEVLRKARDMGSTFPNVNSKELSLKPIVVPPLSEQQRIAEILSTVDEKLEVLQDKKQQYQELKKGLMQQLLTGKKRVTNLLTNAVPA